MSRPKNILALAALAGLALSSAASAGWLHFANSVVQAEDEIQKHPSTLTHIIVFPEDAAKPNYCASYHSTVGQGGKGRVVATATVIDELGNVETVKFAGKVRKNTFLKCKKGPSLSAGAIVDFEYEFKKMPRLRTKDDGAELADVSSVISTGGQPELGQAVPLGLVPANGIVPLGLIPAEAGGWYHSAKAVFQPDDGSQKHPKALAQLLLIPAEAKRPKVCVAYSNAADEWNQGRVVTTVTIDRADGEAETLKFSGGVKQNEYLNCKKLGSNLGPGDMVVFDHQLKGMPRLKTADEGVEFADINGVISTSGEPLFREPPPPPPPPPAPKEEPVAADSAPPPTPAAPQPPAAPAPPPTGGGGGSISAADEQAVFKLLKSSTKGTQLWRAKGNSPGKWVVVGPKTQVISGNKLDYSTAGVGSTISAAVADYERKTKTSLGAGGAVTSTERSLLQWYSGINAAGGPTSVRRDQKGGYHGEYYRPSKGARVKKTSSLSAALDWLKSEGL